MAWTANLRAAERVNGDVRLTIDFTNGTDSATQYFTLSTPQTLKSLVSSAIVNLDALDAFKASLTTGPIDAAPDPVVPPTQAQIDEGQFMRDYKLWTKVKSTLIDTGILTGNEAPVIALKAKVQSEFKPAYLNDL